MQKFDDLAFSIAHDGVLLLDPRNYKLGTRLSSAMKNWPLWSLFAVALSLSVVLVVPGFREVVVPSGAIALTCAVVVAWIFVLSRAIEPIVKWYQDTDMVVNNPPL